MLIRVKLGDGFLTAGEDVKRDVVSASELLVRCFAQGIHIVSFDDAGSGLLKKLGGMSDFAFSILRRSVESSEIRGLYRSVNLYLELDPECLVDKVEKVGGQTVLRGNLRKFAEISAVQTAGLVCENSNDCRVYRYLARAWGLTRSFRNPLKFTEFGGGGSTTFSIVETMKNEGRIFLSVLDGDIRYPGGQVGGTAKKALQIDGLAPYQQVMALSLRTIENVIADELYLLVFERGELNGCVRRMSELKSILSDDLWQNYADLKNGVRLEKVHRMTGPESIFWKQYAAILFPQGCVCHTPVDGVNADCVCLLVPGLGDKVPALVSDWLEKHRYPSANLRGFFRLSAPDVEMVAAMIWSWGCVYPQIGT